MLHIKYESFISRSWVIWWSLLRMLPSSWDLMMASEWWSMMAEMVVRAFTISTFTFLVDDNWNGLLANQFLKLMGQISTFCYSSNSNCCLDKLSESPLIALQLLIQAHEFWMIQFFKETLKFRMRINKPWKCNCCDFCLFFSFIVVELENGIPSSFLIGTIDFDYRGKG